MTNCQVDPAAKMELRSVASLIPYANNARTHTDEQVSQIAASIREWGWTVPVLVDEKSTIIAGHCRVQAAQKLGLEKIPVVVAVGWSKAQRKAYVIADNQLTINAAWDDDLLRVEMEDLRNCDVDLDLLGFDADVLEDLLGDVDESSFPDLPDGDREPFQQMTFTVHDDQAKSIVTALASSKANGPFVDSFNENSNGNALARICDAYLSQNG